MLHTQKLPRLQGQCWRPVRTAPYSHLHCNRSLPNSIWQLQHAHRVKMAAAGTTATNPSSTADRSRASHSSGTDAENWSSRAQRAIHDQRSAITSPTESLHSRCSHVCGLLHAVGPSVVAHFEQDESSCRCASSTERSSLDDPRVELAGPPTMSTITVVLHCAGIDPPQFFHFFVIDS